MAEIYTNHLIALCDILDTYESFRDDLKELVKNKNAVAKINNLNYIFWEKMVLGNRDVKKFYHKYKDTLVIINRNTFLKSFLFQMIYARDIEFFYNYLVAHKEELDRVKKLLKKISALGIDKITYEDRFFDETYRLDYVENPASIFFDKTIIYYMANLEIIPNYNSDYQYHSTSTPYQMKINIYNSHIYCADFIVNSLTFDSDLLPQAITKEYIYDKVMSLVRENPQIKQYAYDMREALKLSFPISELEKGYTSLLHNIDTLNNQTDKEKLSETLKELKLILAKLKKLQDEYNQSIIDRNSLITKEAIEKEQTLYLQRLNDMD